MGTSLQKMLFLLLALITNLLFFSETWKLVYEKQKIALQRDLEEYQKALDELKQNEDERYGYMQVSARVFKELFEKAKEHKVSFQAKKEDEDNSYIIQTPRSEEPYLAAAVADIKKRIQGDSQAPRNAPRLRR